MPVGETLCKDLSLLPPKEFLSIFFYFFLKLFKTLLPLLMGFVPTHARIGTTLTSALVAKNGNVLKNGILKCVSLNVNGHPFCLY